MGSRAHVQQRPNGDSQMFHSQGQGEGAGLSRWVSGVGSRRKFSHIPSVISVNKRPGHGLQARETGPGGSQREEKV